MLGLANCRSMTNVKSKEPHQDCIKQFDSQKNEAFRMNLCYTRHISKQGGDWGWGGGVGGGGVWCFVNISSHY